MTQIHFKNANKLIAFLMCILVLFFFACKNDRDELVIIEDSSEPKSILDDIYNSNVKLYNSLDDVESPSDFAKALDGHTQRMADLAPKMILFQEKYPELMTGNVPDELKEQLDRNWAFDEKLNKAATPLMEKYVDDPEVNRALTRLHSLVEHECDDSDENHECGT